MEQLQNILNAYNINCRVVNCKNSPSIMLYGVQLFMGMKERQLKAVLPDVARNMNARSIVIDSVVDGIIYLAVTRNERDTVLLSSLLSQKVRFENKLDALIGIDSNFNPIVVDLAKAPHSIALGQSGAGKSVFLHSVICSLMYHNTPRDLEFVMIDVKRVEFNLYRNCPFLWGNVVQDCDTAFEYLSDVVDDMQHRYEVFADVGVRNISEYNSLAERAEARIMPYRLIVIDEIADLFMQDKRIEPLLIRICQLGRACGFHCLLCTQRPSRDIIKGLLQANAPTRFALRVGSAIESRVAIGKNGAETLLGKGDMLYLDGNNELTRVQAPYASTQELEDFVNVMKCA